MKKAVTFLNGMDIPPDMLSKSQFSRRLSSIPESVWRALLRQLAMPFHAMNSLKIYLADSFPVPVCRNIRIRRCKIYQDECFRGRVSSRKEYFYGLKINVLMAEPEIPIEIFLSPWAYSDANSLYDFSFPLSAGIVVCEDKSYNTEDEAQAARCSFKSCQKEYFKKNINHSQGMESNLSKNA